MTMTTGQRRNALVKIARQACKADGHDMPPFAVISTTQSRASCTRCMFGCRVDAAQPDAPYGEPIRGAAFTTPCPGDAFAEERQS